MLGNCSSLFFIFTLIIIFSSYLFIFIKSVIISHEIIFVFLFRLMLRFLLSANHRDKLSADHSSWAWVRHHSNNLNPSHLSSWSKETIVIVFHLCIRHSK